MCTVYAADCFASPLPGHLDILLVFINMIYTPLDAEFKIEEQIEKQFLEKLNV